MQQTIICARIDSGGSCHSADSPFSLSCPSFLKGSFFRDLFLFPSFKKKKRKERESERQRDTNEDHTLIGTNEAQSKLIESTSVWYSLIQTHAVRPCESSTAAYLHQADSADRADRFYTPKGASSSRRLADDVFVALLKLWRIHSPDYSALVERFELEQKNHKRNNRLNCLVSNIADWRPTHNALTQKQVRWVTMQNHVKVLITV